MASSEIEMELSAEDKAIEEKNRAYNLLSDACLCLQDECERLGKTHGKLLNQNHELERYVNRCKLAQHRVMSAAREQLQS